MKDVPTYVIYYLDEKISFKLLTSVKLISFNNILIY